MKSGCLVRKPVRLFNPSRRYINRIQAFFLFQILNTIKKTVTSTAALSRQYKGFNFSYMPETRDNGVMWSQKSTLINMLSRSTSMPNLSAVDAQVPILSRCQSVPGMQGSQSEEHDPEKPQRAIIEEPVSETGVPNTGGHSPVVSLYCLDLISPSI